MDPVTAISMVSGISGAVQNIALLILRIRNFCQQVKVANVYLVGLIAQLNTIKSALEQIDILMQTGKYDYQVQMDLDLAIQASELHIALLDKQLVQFKTKRKDPYALRVQSKIRTVFESDGMEACCTRLDRQANALNLLITVLTSRTITEQKTMLQRSKSRKVFDQVREDAASMHVLTDSDSFTTARRNPGPLAAKLPWRRFDFDNEVSDSRAYQSRINRPTRRWSDKNTVQDEVSDLSDNRDFIAEKRENDDIDRQADRPSLPRMNSNFLSRLLKRETDKDAAMQQTDELEFHEDFVDDEQEHESVPTAKYLCKVLSVGDGDAIRALVSHGRHIWGLPEEALPVPHRGRDATIFKLNTPCYDISIYHHIDVGDAAAREQIGPRYRDVSCVIMVIKLADYTRGAMSKTDGQALKFDHHSVVFHEFANDHHLLLARIALLLDTTGLQAALSERPAQPWLLGDGEKVTVKSFAHAVKLRVGQAGGIGASSDRIHVLVGVPDDIVASAIFAIASQASQERTHKWLGLRFGDLCDHKNPYA
ncbi:hypothetical protein LTR08_000371 [Meristemomyces frigidus]|nr:hypothetical protein LTR08_000371 [Meristemomyces frigidus]